MRPFLFDTNRIHEMMTKRFETPRGLVEDTPFYGFYVKVTGESRQLLKEAKQKTGIKLGSDPSNPVLLDELLKAYVR